MHGTEIGPQSQGQKTDLAKIFELISKVLSTTGDPALRRSVRDFTRDGPLSPELLTTLLLYMAADGNRRGYAHLLDGFWDEARCFGLTLPTEEPVAGSSFCKARHKITCDLLRRLVHEVAGTFDESFGNSLRWHGRRSLMPLTTGVGRRACGDSLIRNRRGPSPVVNGIRLPRRGETQ